jgi:hypothetical protein
MTALCAGGGSSSIKAGVQDNLVLSAGGAGALALVAGLEWLGAVAPVLGFVAYKLPDICATDPPGFPTFTPEEVVALSAFVLGDDFNSGVQKVKDTLTTIVWYNFCECDAGAQPTLPAVPTDPGGYTTIQPPQLPIDTCAEWVSPTVQPTSDFFNYHLFGLTFAAGGAPGEIIPTGATSVVVTMHNVVAGAIHDSEDFRFFPYSSSTGGGSSPFAVVNVASGVTTSVTYKLPAGTVGFSAEVGRHTGGMGNTNDAFMEVAAYCGGVPGQVVSPCCPPDDRLTQLLMTLITQTTLIQRQAAPFGYVYGDNHTGLTGDGELAVADLLGVSVDVTTLPDSYGREAGTPEIIFAIGWVSMGTDDGWLKSARIDHDGTLLLPPGAGLYTRVGYTAAAGVEIAIRELVREP